MKLKRLITSINAQFDDLVSKVENHEAVAESAIKQARQNTAKIHIQVNAINRRLDNLEKQYAQLEQKVSTWKQRALSCAETDRDKALQCVQASKAAQTEAEQVLQQIKETSRLKQELQVHLNEAEQQVMSLQHRKESLSARAAKTKVVQSTTSTVEADLEQVFDQWEQNLAQNEYLTTPELNTGDDLDQMFTKQENQQALESALDDLLANHKES